MGENIINVFHKSLMEKKKKISLPELRNVLYLFSISAEGSNLLSTTIIDGTSNELKFQKRKYLGKLSNSKGRETWK